MARALARVRTDADGAERPRLRQGRSIRRTDLMGPRERLLYLSPVVPATTGNGLAMRAGTVLRALAERYDVTLLVVPLYISPAPTVPAEIADRCRRIVIEPLAVAG